MRSVVNQDTQDRIDMLAKREKLTFDQAISIALYAGLSMFEILPLTPPGRGICYTTEHLKDKLNEARTF